MLVETPLESTVFVIFAYLLAIVIGLLIAGLMYLLSRIIGKTSGKGTSPSQKSG